MIHFAEEKLALPVRPENVGSGYGSTIVPIPNTSSVVLSLPSRGSRSPWCVVDLASGDVRRGTGLPGDLRALIFPGPDDRDSRPWALASFGLCRLGLDGNLVVEDIHRKDVGKYKATLVDISADVLGVGHPLSGSLLLLAKHDRSRIKRVRTPGPDLAYRLKDRTLRFVGHASGTCADFDIDDLRIVSRKGFPKCRGTRKHGDRLVTLIGDTKPIRQLPTFGEPESGEPIVLSTGTPNPEVDLGSWLDVHRIAVIDANTLDILKEARVRGGAVEVLGIHSNGSIVVASRTGFDVLDPETLRVIGSYSRRVDGAAFVPELDAVVLQHEHHGVGSTLHILRW